MSKDDLTYKPVSQEEAEMLVTMARAAGWEASSEKINQYPWLHLSVSAKSAGWNFKPYDYKVASRAEILDAFVGVYPDKPRETVIALNPRLEFPHTTKYDTAIINHASQEVRVGCHYYPFSDIVKIHAAITRDT